MRKHPFIGCLATQKWNLYNLDINVRTPISCKSRMFCVSFVYTRLIACLILQWTFIGPLLPTLACFVTFHAEKETIKRCLFAGMKVLYVCSVHVISSFHRMSVFHPTLPPYPFLAVSFFRSVFIYKRNSLLFQRQLFSGLSQNIFSFIEPS